MRLALRRFAVKVITSFQAPAVLALLGLILSWKLVLTNQYTWLDAPDFATQVLPWFEFQAQQWHLGHFPMWDPYHWLGFSFIGQGQTQAAYPPAWLLFLLPLDNGHISWTLLNWYLPLTRLMAALFCYLLCRDLKASRAAAVLASTVFAFAGYIGTTDWPQMLGGAVWAPLVLLFFLRAMRDPERLMNAALSGAFLGLALLSGHHQIPTFTALMIAGLAIHELWTRPGQARQLIPAFGILGVTAFLVSALQTLPAYEYWHTALRWVNANNPVGWDDKVPYTVHELFSLNPSTLPGFIVPGIQSHSAPFVGAVALAMAFAGCVLGWRERKVRVFASIALGGLVFALGADSIFQGALYALVPMVEKARSPSMAIFICHLGIAGLVAFGLDALRTPKAREGSVVRWIIRVGLAVAGAVYVGLTCLWVTDPAKAATERRLAMVALICVLLAALLAAWRRSAISQRTALALVILLATLDIGSVSGFHHPNREQGWRRLQQYAATADLAAFLARQPGPVRVSIDRDQIQINFGDWYGIEQYEGYHAGLTTTVFNVFPDDHARMVLGQNYTIAKVANRPGQQQVFTGSSGLSIYRNPDAFPRAWSVHDAASVERRDVLSRFQQPLDDLRSRTFIVGDAPKLEPCAGGDRVTLVDHWTTHTRIRAEMACTGMVVLSDTFAAGWQATVDGSPARIYEAYGVVRGVVVPAGFHTVEMRYRPGSVYLGAAFSAVGICLIPLLWFLDRRRRNGVSIEPSLTSGTA